MKKLTILTALLFCIPLIAQDEPHIYWEYLPTAGEYDGDDYDRRFEGCAQDTIDGYYYCATSSEDHNCGPSSGTDISVVKFDNNGNEVGQTYLCALDGPNEGTQEPWDMVYSEGSLYMIADGYVTDGSQGNNNQDILEQVSQSNNSHNPYDCCF